MSQIKYFLGRKNCLSYCSGAVVAAVSHLSCSKGTPRGSQCGQVGERWTCRTKWDQDSSVWLQHTVWRVCSNQSGFTIFLARTISRPQQPLPYSLLQTPQHKLSSWDTVLASPDFPMLHLQHCFCSVSQWLPFDVNCLQAKLSGERSCSLVCLLVTTEPPRPVEKMLWC